MYAWAAFYVAIFLAFFAVLLSGLAVASMCVLWALLALVVAFALAVVGR